MTLPVDTSDGCGETISLLQDEIARLEAELQARDDEARAAASEGPAWSPPAAPLGPTEETSRLESELAERDELIVALLEQGRLYEEVAEASRLELEQLTAWVEVVERRIESRGQVEGDLAVAYEDERRRVESLRQEWGDEKRAWEAEKAVMGGELRHLRERLAARAGGTAAETEELERENKKLRKALDGLARAATLAEEVGPLREQLGAAMSEVDRLNAALANEADERQRESIEGAATIRALQSKLALIAAGAAEPEPPKAPEEGADSYREVDERIRAFRQHLRELHEREEAERSARSLSSRLSRLWRHTSSA